MPTTRYNIESIADAATGREVLYSDGMAQIDGLKGGTVKIDVSAGGTINLDAVAPRAHDNFFRIELTGTPGAGFDIVMRDEEWVKWFGNFTSQIATITTLSGPSFKPTIAAGNGCKISNTNQGGTPAAELRRNTPETAHST